MKKYLSILALAALTACSNEEDFSLNPKEIRLTSTVGFMTRAASDLQNTQIANGQEVGVIIQGAASEHNNVAWTANGEGKLEPGQPAYWGNEGSIKVYAYHPHYDVDLNNEYASFKFNVEENQSEEKNYLNSDLLWAEPVESSDKSGALTLNFVHKLSKIIVKLTGSSEGEDLSNATISICNVYKSADFTPMVNNGAVFNTDTYEKVDIIAGTGSEASAIIIPQYVGWGNKFIKIEVGDKVYYYTPKEGEEKQFEGGKVYTFNLTIRASVAVKLSTTTVTQWDESPSGTTGDLNEYLSKIPYDMETTEYAYSGLLTTDEIEVLREMMTKGNLAKLDLSGATVGNGVDINFQNCYKLKEIKLPSNLTRLSNYSFADNNNLTDVTINVSSLKEVQDGVFANCPNLTTITLEGESENPKMFMEDGILYRVEDFFGYESQEPIERKWVLWCPRSKTSVTLPEDVYGIGSYVFKEMLLTSITLPSTVGEIGFNAFAGVALTEITCKAATPPNLNSEWAGSKGNPDYLITSSTILYVPSASVDAYKAQTEGNEWPNHFTENNIQPINE